MDSLLVVGSGLAGLSAVRAARELGFTGRVTVLGAEPHRPYDRPPLSKDYLAGTAARTDLDLLSQDEDLGVEWRHGSAVALDLSRGVLPAGGTVRTDDGTTLTADGVVLATGSVARTLPDLPEDAENLHVLRTVDDADRLRTALVPGTRLVVVGAGLIGSEIAATATGLGCAVTLLDASARPLDRLYGTELAPRLAALHSQHGVELRAEAKISGVRMIGDRVATLTLADGVEIPADAVLVAVGGEAATGWLRSSGLEVTDGVPCDSVGRALRPSDGLRTAQAQGTDGGEPVPGVVAVGDVAAWWDPHLQRHHRAQHWTDALERPALAVGALLGVTPRRRKPYLPYFWSDQYGHHIQMAGYASLADDVEVVDDDPATGQFCAVYRRGGEPVAALALSRPREFTRWRKTLVGSLGHVPEEPTDPSRMAAPAASAPHPHDLKEHV